MAGAMAPEGEQRPTLGVGGRMQKTMRSVRVAMGGRRLTVRSGSWQRARSGRRLDQQRRNGALPMIEMDSNGGRALGAAGGMESRQSRRRSSGGARRSSRRGWPIGLGLGLGGGRRRPISGRATRWAGRSREATRRVTYGRCGMQLGGGRRRRAFGRGDAGQRGGVWPAKLGPRQRGVQRRRARPSRRRRRRRLQRAGAGEGRRRDGR